MIRLHLFEFEDLAFCPLVLRDALTGFLRLLVRLTGQADPVVPRLAEVLADTGESRILDLCSGSGGIALEISEGLAIRGFATTLTLSDRYPARASLDRIAKQSRGRIDFLSRSLDARSVPACLPGLRTLFNAFHHFPPEAARSILASAAQAGRPIAVFEFIDRGPIPLLGILVSPVLFLIMAPFIRPRRWQTLFFTYLVPLLPSMVLWDGIVSWLRVYSEQDLRALAEAAGGAGYSWEIGRLRVNALIHVRYLIGSVS